MRQPASLLLFGAFAGLAAIPSQADDGRRPAGREEPSREASRGASAAASAGTLRAAPQQEREHFRRIDADGDGYLSDPELASRTADRSQWIALDRDGDGRISRDEFVSIR